MFVLVVFQFRGSSNATFSTHLETSPRKIYMMIMIMKQTLLFEHMNIPAPELQLQELCVMATYMQLMIYVGDIELKVQHCF